MAMIGKLSVGIGVQTSALSKGLKSASNMISGFASTATKVGGILGTVFAGASAYGLAKGLGAVITKASDLAEASSLVGVAFGDSASKVVSSSEKMALAFGVSRTEFLSAASALGAMLTNMGYTKDQAADVSISLVKLAKDLQSAFNIKDFGEATAKLQSALAGESEPLRRYGVDISDVAVKAQAAKMGIKAMNGELAASQKTQARLAIIMEKTKVAQGDLGRTADGVANSMRAVEGRVEFLSEALGQALEPVVKSVLGDLNTAVQALTLYWEDNKNSVVAWGQSTVGAVAGSSESMGFLQKSIGFIADAWQYAKQSFRVFLVATTEGVAAIVDNLSFLEGAIGAISKALSGTEISLSSFGKGLHDLADKQWKGFEKELNKPLAHLAIDEYFARAQSKITAAQKEAAKPGTDISKLTPANAPAATAKGNAVKYASAVSAGSKEAANAVLQSRYGASMTAKGPADQTAKNTGEANKLLGKIYSQLSSQKPAGMVGNALAGLSNS
jgi:hypothetical protein